MSDPWTWHGGGLEAARARFGDGTEPWLDLSTGINPHAWPGAASLDIDWHRLPEDHHLRALEAVAAVYFAVDPRHLCAVPGTEIGLRLSADIVGAPAAYVMPAYRTHEELVTPRIALEPIALPWSGGTVILAHPNNPDGRLLSRELLCRQLASAEAADGWLVIDEAFADATPEVSLANQIGDERRLIIFRSFGKFFGLAGVRLGFVLAPSAVIARYRTKLGAWPLSSAALAIGTAAYRDRRWSEAMRPALQEQAASLDLALARCGLSAIGACPLFRLIQTENAMSLFERLAQKAILTRPFAYQPHWLRIGLPENAAALDRLEAALRDG